MMDRIKPIILMAFIFFLVFCVEGLESKLKKHHHSNLKKIRSELCHSSNFSSCENLVHEIICDISPQEKRTEELAKLINECQSEMTEKLKYKKITQSPVISVIIPCYNREKVIQEVVESIYNQNFSVPFEVIAVDDASKDQSYEVLMEYEKKYENFFAFKNEKNLKAPATRNRAVALSRGDYIINADSDDVFEPDTLDGMFQGMVKNGCEVAFFDELRFFSSNIHNVDSISKANTPSEINDVEALIKIYFIGSCAGNRIYSKNSWLKSGGYLEKPGHDSWAFSYKLLANGYRAYIQTKSGYFHRIWEDQSNMWHDDNRNGVTSVSPTTALFENSEIFLNKSFNYLKRYQPSLHGDFMEFLKNGANSNKIKFLPKLSFLLDAYFLENKGDYNKSLEKYKEVLKDKDLNEIILLKSLRAAIKSKDVEFALEILNKIK